LDGLVARRPYEDGRGFSPQRGENLVLTGGECSARPPFPVTCPFVPIEAPQTGFIHDTVTSQRPV
jgi:hypothetical protein